MLVCGVSPAAHTIGVRQLDWRPVGGAVATLSPSSGEGPFFYRRNLSGGIVYDATLTETHASIGNIRYHNLDTGEIEIAVSVPGLTCFFPGHHDEPGSHAFTLVSGVAHHISFQCD